MPRGANAKREREYEDLKGRFEKSGRYRGREEEVAARIVNKQRRRFGETKQARRQEEVGRSPARNLPIRGYLHLTAIELRPRIEKLSVEKLKNVREYEMEHKNRKGVIQMIDRRLKAV